MIIRLKYRKVISIKVRNSKIKEFFLVTTGLEETWPDKGQATLFLGEWCRLYCKKNLWLEMDAEVMPYHWDNRKKLYKDYQYLLQFFEKILMELTIELNKIHNVSYSRRYWRIIIGPWLMGFLTIIFDRYSSLNLAINKYHIIDTKVLEEFDLKWVPQNMEHYCKMVTSDAWNHLIYSSILKFIKFKKITQVKKSKTFVQNHVSNDVKQNLSTMSKIKNFLITFSNFFQRKTNYFFISTYLTNIDLIKLQLKLYQIPVFNRQHYSYNFEIHESFRKISLLGLKCNSKFEEFAREIIPLQLPLSYLEGFKNLSKVVNKIGWPSKPKLIWTSNAFHMDEIFKFWAAEKVEHGSPLIIGQHGGNYGQALFNMTEYHELAISDYYFSWGWKDNIKKIIPVGTVKKPLQRKRKRKNRSCVLIISAASRYVGGIQSIPLSSQWIDYFDDQMKFYSELPSKISSNIKVRVYPHDYQWFQTQRWKDKFPNTRFDNCEEKFNDVLIKSDLVISGWNTTAYLESILSNVPTIIFWNSKYFEIREDAKELFKELKKVGIYHDNPISASNHVKKIWKNINKWWDDRDVIVARREFTKKYMKSYNLLDNIYYVFKDISRRH